MDWNILITAGSGWDGILVWSWITVHYNCISKRNPFGKKAFMENQPLQWQFDGLLTVFVRVCLYVCVVDFIQANTDVNSREDTGVANNLMIIIWSSVSMWVTLTFVLHICVFLIAISQNTWISPLCIISSGKNELGMMTMYQYCTLQ